ncbi:energy transducer TonB [Pseudofulvibacter geojedonensis]|uniref:Energy transducer TonB n=1 Tax=Pseudofulvibacter geojedonensis TaxID=1123758 RepID=A0ABW3I1Z5_9FLAO
MKAKKNPNIDISKSSSIYFALGLAVMMFVVYLGMNHKSYKKAKQEVIVLKVDASSEEEIPITELKNLPPPPPPPPAPVVIEIVENEEEIIETVIESTETDESEEIETVELKVEEVIINEVEEEIEVPFTVIENVPIFPGCETYKTNSDRKKCMSVKISKFVSKKFDNSLAADLGLSGKMRISVIFKIDKKGNVVKVRARAPHPELVKEAEQVVNSLPKMKPGIQMGKPVTVSYSLPILFEVRE